MPHTCSTMLISLSDNVAVVSGEVVYCISDRIGWTRMQMENILDPLLRYA